MVKKFVLWICMLFLFVTFVNANLYDNLSIYCSLDDNSIYNGVSNCEFGTGNWVLNGSTSGNNGYNNEALNFSEGVASYYNGSFYDYDFDANEDFTINFWINFSEFDVEINENFLAQGYTHDRGWSFFRPNTQRINFDLKDSLCTVNLVTDLTINNWSMITVVFNNTNDMLYIYLNGTLNNNNTHADCVNINPYGNGLYMGMSYWENEGLTGLIDEFAIWNRALTSTEVLNLSTNFYPLLDTLVLYVYNEYNNDSISDFFVVIDGVTYNNVFNGTYDTFLSDESVLHNITIGGEYWNNYTILNHNVSNDINVTLNLTTLEVATPVFSPDYPFYVPTTTNVSCDYNFSNTGFLNVSYEIEHVDNGSDWNQSSSIINLNNNDIYDRLNVACWYCTPYQCVKSSDHSIYRGETNNILTFNILGSGNLLSNINITFNNSLSTNDNPSTFYLSNFFGPDPYNMSFDIVVRDLSNAYSVYNSSILIYDNVTEYNITLSPNVFSIYFEQNNVSYNTSGFIYNQNQSSRFINVSQLIFNQTLLNSGYVHIRFNLFDGENHTQFYEYLNDFDETNETIEILDNPVLFNYFRVLDYGNSPIKDVKIRIYESNYSVSFINFSEHKLIGQRLTDDQGYTFFYFDYLSTIHVEITADGYNDVNLIMTVGDESFPKTDPILIYLSDTEPNPIYNCQLSLPSKVYNKSNNIDGFVYSPYYSDVEINTDYRLGLGLSRKDLTTSDSRNRYFFELISGTDFNNVNNDNITVLVYQDNNLCKNFTIYYDNRNKTRILSPSDQLVNVPQNYLDMLIYLFLIIFAGVLSYVYKHIEMSIHAFYIGCILLALISSTFYLLAGVVMFKYVMVLFKRIVSE